MLNHIRNILHVRSSIPQILIIAVLATPIPSQVSAGLGQILADTRINAEDLSLIKSTAKDLYDVDKPKVGSHSSWENTQSGASGIITITDNDGRCVSLRHNITLPLATPKEQEYNVRRCKDDNGVWRLEAPN